MSNAYALVHWNRHKRVYDLVIALAICAYLATFVAAGMLLWRGERAISPPILLMRALGTCGLIMLHIILCIGPAARISPRMAPLLYNRRHLGVSMFLVALAHAALAVLYYGAFGVVGPAWAVLGSARGWGSVGGFPFEWPGFAALLILFVMASTSHDFWLANLSPRIWKSLHMMVYAGYALLILHVALGALQSERSPVYPALLAAGILIVSGLHIAAGHRERRRDIAAEPPVPDAQWVDVGAVDEIPESRAKVVCIKGRERIAVFRHDGKVSAVSNVCAHQSGPLGEGKIVGGCITCPWHGYQYLPQNGQSPPPFTEKIPTYQVRVEGRRVLLNPCALAPGTPVEPAIISGTASSEPSNA